MKRRDLITDIERGGCILLRHGAKHDIYHQPKTGKSEPVPRHREINEYLAKKILKALAAPEEKSG